jgi:hydrogenase nickel incorporation protein HypA/HybF
MHELGVTKSIIEMIERECNAKGIRNPKKAVVEIGALTTYLPDSIMFYYDLLKAETPAVSGMKLELVDVKARIVCQKCKAESIIDDPYFIICPKCKSAKFKITGGKDIVLKEIHGK